MSKNNFLMLGYKNFNDLIEKVFGTKHFGINLIFASISGLSSLITTYIWDDAKAIYILLFLILIDATTGIMRSIKQHKFSSSRLPRILVIMVLYTAMLSLGWNLAKINSLFVWLPSALYAGFVTTLAISIFENSNQLGYVPNNIYFYVKNKINLLQSFLFGVKFNDVEKEHPSIELPSGIYQTNTMGDCVYVNQKYCDILETEKEAVYGKGWLKFIHEDDKNRIFNEFYSAVKYRQEFKSTYRMVTSSGSILNVAGYASPIFDKSNVLSGYLGTIITDAEN